MNEIIDGYELSWDFRDVNVNHAVVTAKSNDKSDRTVLMTDTRNQYIDFLYDCTDTKNSCKCAAIYDANKADGPGYQKVPVTYTNCSGDVNTYAIDTNTTRQCGYPTLKGRKWNWSKVRWEYYYSKFLVNPFSGAKVLGSKNGTGTPTQCSCDKCG